MKKQNKQRKSKIDELTNEIKEMKLYQKRLQELNKSLMSKIKLFEGASKSREKENSKIWEQQNNENKK